MTCLDYGACSVYVCGLYLEEDVALDLYGAFVGAEPSRDRASQQLLDQVLSVTRDVDGKDQLSVQDPLLGFGLAAVGVEGGASRQ